MGLEVKRKFTIPERKALDSDLMKEIDQHPLKEREKHDTRILFLTGVS
jgi:hypothetical protein